MRYKDNIEDFRDRTKHFYNKLNKLSNKINFDSKLTDNKYFDSEGNKAISHFTDENDSLARSFKMSSNLNVDIDENLNEINKQNDIINKTSNNIEKILVKIPVFNNLIGEIGYYRFKEQVILGLVTGVCLYIFLSLSLG